MLPLDVAFAPPSLFSYSIDFKIKKESKKGIDISLEPEITILRVNT